MHRFDSVQELVNNVTKVSACFSIGLLLLLLVGCDGEFQMVAVSGTVTMDGRPLADAQVVFAPMESKDNMNPGPVSIGTTDEEGRFSLKTQAGVNGAVVVTHRVGISFGELDESAVAAIVDAILEKNRSMSEAEYLQLEEKTKRELADQRSVPLKYNKQSTLTFEVKAATDSANFDLTSE